MVAEKVVAAAVGVVAAAVGVAGCTRTCFQTNLLIRLCFGSAAEACKFFAFLAKQKLSKDAAHLEHSCDHPRQDPSHFLVKKMPEQTLQNLQCQYKSSVVKLNSSCFTYTFLKYKVIEKMASV